MDTTKKCPVCSRPTYSPRARYCSPKSACRSKAYRERKRDAVASQNVTERHDNLNIVDLHQMIAEMQQTQQSILQAIKASGGRPIASGGIPIISGNLLVSQKMDGNGFTAAPTGDELGDDLDIGVAKSDVNVGANLISKMNMLADEQAANKPDTTDDSISSFKSKTGSGSAFLAGVLAV